ncbi:MULTISPECIES: hypothetical protein [Streptomycetaceae]|uniref:hypothetical protein n=1 Tax=Streptomycetaceae TaxID=2062 RepID=UPI00036C9762|nr:MULTISPECIES: hypothetical protein [unclassified Streptomyces]MYX32262.1 hypothetical protein [Streptomyces sp. SID8377]
MTVHLPLIAVLAALGYFGLKLTRVPTWLVLVLVLGGFYLADTFLAPAVDSGTRTGVEIVNGTTK